MAPESVHTDILDNLKTAILLLEPDLTVNYLNAAAEDLLKTSSNRVKGEHISTLFHEVEGDSGHFFNAINTAFTKREVRIHLPNQHQITIDYAVTPVIDNEQVTALLLELQPLDRLLRISRDEGILSSQQSARALVRGLAHEIKNPLGGLRGAAQLLEKELADKSLLDYTQIIIEEADRLTKLVDSLLGPRALPTMAPINIHEILERVCQLTEAEVGDSIAIIRDYDPSIPELIGDKEQLIQAILNIVRNAMQALQQEPDTPNPQIRLRTRILRQFTIGPDRHRLVCQVEITDNGPGIPTDIAENIFLPTVSGNANGNGLGLSISQSIINHHKGLIECNSQPGHTRFSINLPLETTHE